MTYLRFVRPNKAACLAAREGFFCAAYALRETGHLDPHTAQHLETLLRWFRTNLPVPDRFNRTGSKGAGRRNTAGLCWFRQSASPAIGRSFELVTLLGENGYPIDIIRTDRVGYIVYEDAMQVVAEPFSDTPV